MLGVPRSAWSNVDLKPKTPTFQHLSAANRAHRADRTVCVSECVILARAENKHWAILGRPFGTMHITAYERRTSDVGDSRQHSLSHIPANLFGESIEAAAGEVVVDGPAFVGFVEAVEDSVDHRSQSDAGDFDDSSRQRELLEIAEDFFPAAILAELLALVKQFHAGEVAAPFVIEWAVVATTVRHPKSRTFKPDGVCRHSENSAATSGPLVAR